ncbi:MAG: hypothetical protein ACYDER_11045 [Ktedonobacteraceae bacterium]
MEQEQGYYLAEEHDDAEYVKRREALAYQYVTLPAYGSLAYWRVVEETDATFALPIE